MSRIVPISILLFLSACATQYPECQGDKQCERDKAEYARVEYLETRFKPGVAACEAEGGTIVYQGPMTQKMRRILDKEDWDRLDRLDTNYFFCWRRDR